MGSKLCAWALLACLSWLPGAAAADDGALSRALTRQMELNRQRYGVAGQAVLVAHNGRVLFRGSDGLADRQRGERATPEHVFASFSLSKLFVSTLLMQLVEQGAVRLEAPIQTYLPELPQRWRPIPVRDFLDHSSGVPEYFARDPRTGMPALPFPKDLPSAFAALADTPLQFAPGNDTRYTQTNYLVLTALLERHYGQPYPQIADARILRPLKLRHTWLGPDRLPEQGVAANYAGKDGGLQPETDAPWPSYAYGHAALYTDIDDLGRFLQAMSAGELVGKATLQRLWQPRTLGDGRRGGFAGGWEYGESGRYRELGHDGGTRVRARIAYTGSLDGDVYLFVYLSNGSARKVWSRVLLDSAMAAVAPDAFPREALGEALIGYALRAPVRGDAQAFAQLLRADSPLSAADLERSVNASGYSIRENLGPDPALRVFELNTQLFPDSANAWDSLAETYAAKGDAAQAKAAYAKARQRSERAKPGH
ncbi:serine hydrolase domain-containing protein [Lysobacter silvisoli]|uniref:Class A beta-lactamase-related serine hydrolase n=1 Tax=Lysobacter silvisoli TaxID=2293254 RepID=A0A371K477_9GAMM|nr:serine hydrolase domain-containing protein [Lysobacter silvisoli]RDZ28664.1 class A beta-lactamase-related serine hydrolase [Lysobacter silvisoli]